MTEKTGLNKPVPSKEKALDEALADSFPASDPIPSATPHRPADAGERHPASDRKSAKQRPTR